MTTTTKPERVPTPRDRETPFTKLVEQLDAAISAERFERSRWEGIVESAREADRRVAFCLTAHGDHDDVEHIAPEPEVGARGGSYCHTCGSVLS